MNNPFSFSKARVLFRHEDKFVAEAVLSHLERQDDDLLIWDGRGVGLSLAESKVALWALSSTHWIVAIE